MGILTFIIERNRIKNKNKSARNCKQKTFRHSTFLNLAKQLNAVKLLLNRCDLFTWYIQLRGNHYKKRLSFTPYTYIQRSSEIYRVELLQNGTSVCKISKNVHKNTPLQHWRVPAVSYSQINQYASPHGFWTPSRGFRIPGTGFQSLSVELGFWISIVRGIPDSLSELYSGFQNPGFQIPLPDMGRYTVWILINFVTQLF